jgi:hypothetical protein
MLHDYWRDAILTDPDITKSRIDGWETILAPYRLLVTHVLDIGAFEGQSAMFWVKFFPDCEVVCIDNWVNAHQPPTEAGKQAAARAELNFDHNVAGLLVRKIKADSTAALYALAQKHARFDLIYVDGDHLRDQVMIDSCLAWQLLIPGGIMIWDDYRDYAPGSLDFQRPETAIDFFVKMQGRAIEHIADTGQQLIARKIGGASR